MSTFTSNLHQTVTLAHIKTFYPCQEGWKKALDKWGTDLSKEVSFLDIARNNGAADAFWCLKCFDFTGEFKEVILTQIISNAVVRAKQYAADTTYAAADTATAYAAYAADAAAIYAANAAAAAASYAVDAAIYAAADAADAAANAAANTTYAADAADAANTAANAADAAEREKQLQDIITTFSKNN